MHLIKKLHPPHPLGYHTSKNDFSQYRKGKRKNDPQRSERWYDEQNQIKYFSPSSKWKN